MKETVREKEGNGMEYLARIRTEEEEEKSEGDSERKGREGKGMDDLTRIRTE